MTQEWILDQKNDSTGITGEPWKVYKLNNIVSMLISWFL